MTAPRWKSQLQPASFRGVNFFVGDAETIIGRRNVLHEYPFRDVPYAEDLGKKAREFNINAYVMGDDYIATRDQLISAVEDNNTPGVLVHPTLGIMNVIPTQCRVIFKNTEGGIEYFVLTFVEAGKNELPSVVVDTQSSSQTTAAQSFSAAESSFSSLFSTNALSDTVASKATAALIGTASGVGGVVVPASTSFVGVIGDILSRGAYYAGTSSSNFSSLKSQLSSFTTNVATIVATPATLASSITSIIAALANAYPNDPEQQLKALIALFNSFGTNFTMIPLDTPSHIQEAINQQQIIDLVQIAALIQMVIAISLIDFESRQDAMGTMNTVELLMEPKLLELGNSGNDEAYNALNAARIAMVLDIKARAATLKTVVYIKNNYSVPALVLAYKTYQDATQEADIVARNKIRNPVFVPPNVEIEILV